MSKLSVSSKIGDNIAYATDDPGMIELDQMAKRFHDDIEAVDVEVSNGVEAGVSVSRIASVINCTTRLILARHTLTRSSLPVLLCASPKIPLEGIFHASLTVWCVVGRPWLRRSIQAEVLDSAAIHTFCHKDWSIRTVDCFRSCNVPQKQNA